MITPLRILAFFQSLGWPEMVVIGLVALLIFGRRLPEVGRSLGKGIVEFKKGLKDTGEDVKGKLPSMSDALPDDKPNQTNEANNTAEEVNNP